MPHVEQPYIRLPIPEPSLDEILEHEKSDKPTSNVVDNLRDEYVINDDVRGKYEINTYEIDMRSYY